MARATLNTQHDYITLRMPNGNFTVSYSGYKASGGLVDDDGGAFKRFVNHVKKERQTKTVGEVMEELTKKELLDSIWSDWDKVVKNEFKKGNKVIVPLKPNYGTGEIYNVNKKTCDVLFKRHGRIRISFRLLEKE